MKLFVFGTLRDEEIFKAVTHADLKELQEEGEAFLEGYGAYYVEGENYPGLKTRAGHKQSGIILNLSQPLMDCLIRYEDPEDYALEKVMVNKEGEMVEVFIFLNKSNLTLTNVEWSLERFYESGEKSKVLAMVSHWMK